MFSSKCHRFLIAFQLSVKNATFQGLESIFQRFGPKISTSVTGLNIICSENMSEMWSHVFFGHMRDVRVTKGLWQHPQETTNLHSNQQHLNTDLQG